MFQRYTCSFEPSKAYSVISIIHAKYFFLISDEHQLQEKTNNTTTMTKVMLVRTLYTLRQTKLIE